MCGGEGRGQGAAFQLSHFNYIRVPSPHISPLPSPVLSSPLSPTLHHSCAFCFPPFSFVISIAPPSPLHPLSCSAPLLLVIYRHGDDMYCTQCGSTAKKKKISLFQYLSTFASFLFTLSLHVPSFTAFSLSNSLPLSLSFFFLHFIISRLHQSYYLCVRGENYRDIERSQTAQQWTE